MRTYEQLNAYADYNSQAQKQGNRLLTFEQWYDRVFQPVTTDLQQYSCQRFSERTGLVTYKVFAASKHEAEEKASELFNGFQVRLTIETGENGRVPTQAEQEQKVIDEAERLKRELARIQEREQKKLAEAQRKLEEQQRRLMEMQQKIGINS